MKSKTFEIKKKDTERKDDYKKDRRQIKKDFVGLFTIERLIEYDKGRVVSLYRLPEKIFLK